MSITLAVYFVALQLLGVPALPIRAISGEELLTGSCSLPNGRTKTSIIWSCLVTIFSCTWVAVHPNIPGPDTTRGSAFVRQVRLLVVALLAPETVICWAMRQWIAAYKLGHKYRCMFISSSQEFVITSFVISAYGWTQAHGYFVIMGGFAIFEGDDVHHIVTTEELDDLLKNREIRITEKEIRDKGRGDGLSKGLVLIQTLWFILQCIARKVEHLPITELELVTLAFAALNFVTYSVWWYKPQNVECPVRVYRWGSKENGDGEVGSGRGGTKDAEAGESIKENESTWRMIAMDIKTATTHLKTAIVRAPVVIIGKAMIEIGCAWRKYVIEFRQHVVWHALAVAFFPVSSLLYGLWYVYHISARLTNQEDDDVIKEGAKNVPTFYAGPELSDDEGRVAVYATCAIAMVFGSVHCIGWSFAFPSYAEELLWRIASISVTSVPVPLAYVVLMSMDRPGRFGLTLAGSILYLIGRLILLVLPFMSLRSLPAEAYQTVEWTTFIPHV
jgi:hypothetical protein